MFDKLNKSLYIAPMLRKLVLKIFKVDEGISYGEYNQILESYVKLQEENIKLLQIIKELETIKLN